LFPFPYIGRFFRGRRSHSYAPVLAVSDSIFVDPFLLSPSLVFFRSKGGLCLLLLQGRPQFCSVSPPLHSENIAPIFLDAVNLCIFFRSVFFSFTPLPLPSDFSTDLQIICPLSVFSLASSQEKVFFAVTFFFFFDPWMSERVPPFPPLRYRFNLLLR